MSWRKVKLGDLCTIEKGKTGIQKAIPGQFPLVVTAEERKSHNEYQFDDEAVIIPLVSGTGHGHASIKRLHFQTGKFALGTILCAIIPKNKNILNAEYLFRFLTLNKDRELVDRMKGMANVTLPIKEISKIEIPLPSLKEQIEFVEKYKLLEINTEKIFDELTHQLDLIKQLRQAFLREAMQGKLVKSSDIVETGQQLLAKIIAKKSQLLTEKKLKKEKEIPLINNDEIPFEIPKHWVWCRLGQVCYTSGRIGWKGLSADEYKKTGPLFLSVHSLNYGDYVDYSKAFHITKERFDESPEIILQNDDILICKDGAGIGKLGIIKNLIEPATINSSLLLIRKNEKLNTKFVYFFFLSSHFQKIVNERIMGATTPHLYQRDIINFPFALPPIHEQQRIVTKLEELMTFCDGLEKSIKESQDYNNILLKQVLREALQPKENIKTISIESKKIGNPLKTILAGHIINLNNTTDFGRVKFQKLLFLTEYICKIDFDSNYIKKVAGPYDDVLIKSIESDFNRMRFFNVVQDKTDNKRVRYTALAGANELENLFLENFSDELVRINSTLLKFRPLSWGECELIATLYAVWNNRIIKNEPITDELLYSDFMAWDKQKSKYHSVFHKWLFWMKDERIIPDGWGKYIDKPQ